MGLGPDWRDLRLPVWLMNCYCKAGAFYCLLYGEERVHLWVGMLSPFTSPFPAMHQCTHKHVSICVDRNTLIKCLFFFPKGPLSVMVNPKRFGTVLVGQRTRGCWSDDQARNGWTRLVSFFSLTLGLFWFTECMKFGVQLKNVLE